MVEPVVAGRFEIEREAGAGAMSRVYRAIDITTRQPVALKVINAVSDHAMRRFAREVSALGELDHPGIVRYVAHGHVKDGRAFLAMEWVDGEVLEDRLERGALGVTDALALARGLAAALGVAHERGLVHRDLKPANVFLVDGDIARPKLLDFGLTRDTTATFGLTNTGDLLGTPLYMAPEQAACELDVDARCDVYALGVLLYRALAGCPPLIAPNLVGLLAKIVLEAPAPLATVCSVPGAVDALVMRMLAKPRADRPADGSAVVREIESVRSHVSSAPPPPQAVRVREQRVVSILLASGSTEQTQSLDATLGNAGGAALALADGSTMVVISGPESPSDLAARAVRYGLAIRSESASVAIATGRALLSGPTPMGEVIERVAALVGDAHGMVRADDETAALIEGRFALGSDDRGHLIIGEHGDLLDPVRTLLGKPTRCVGRDRELAAIEGYFTECVAESAACALLVYADAGVGKSRLAHEVQRRLSHHADAPRIVVVRCESITASSPFAAIASGLRRTADVDVGDPLAREFLDELLGIRRAQPSEQMRAARENPTLMFERIRAACVSWLVAAAANRPMLLVLEDAHWCDDSTMAVIDSALGALAEQPFMVLGLARPELRTRKPWAARRPHELRLDPLARRASERLVRDALGKDASDAVVANILDRAEGNALFLEELVRAAASHSGGDLPIGVIGTLQLRFDRLPAEIRSVLRVASVFGEHFAAAAVASLLPSSLSVSAALDVLIAEELIRSSGEGLSFRHALVREAAYALLADEDRAVAHARAAELLERDAGQEPAVIARHFEAGRRREPAARWFTRAAEHALARNDLDGALRHAQRVRDLSEDATTVGVLDLLVAEIEMWLGHVDLARAAALRAVVTLPEATASWFAAVGLVETAAGQLGDNAVVMRWLTRALELQPEPDAVSAYVQCLSRGSSQLAWTDHSELGHRALLRAEEVAAGHALTPYTAARLEFARAYGYIVAGVTDAALRSLGTVMDMYATFGARRDRLQTEVMYWTVACFYGGHVETRTEDFQRCIDEAEQLGASYLAHWARFELAAMHCLRGELDEGARLFAQVSPVVMTGPMFTAHRMIVMGWNAVTANDTDTLARVVETARAGQMRPRYHATADAFDAFLRFRRGDVAGGCALARQALAGLDGAIGGFPTDLHRCGITVALMVLVEAAQPDASQLLAKYRNQLDVILARLTEAREVYANQFAWNRWIIERT